ncbi:CRISP/Allergen/PR-1-like isoform X2 [Palaemon carinicauda]|uniref:CRISP/Allergen/PR-1-like isoform X2 n=1 Tax=Palaemon carinicauda TaxID=392227 RepID=UPI0035B61FB1
MSGEVKLTTAARKCEFNGQMFFSGDLVVRIDETCTSFYCEPKIKKNGKPMKKKVEIVARMDTLNTCQCDTAPRYTNDVRMLPSGMKQHHVSARNSVVKDKAIIIPRTPHKRRNSRRTRINRKALLRARKNRRKCRFNQKKYKAGQIIMSVPERCMDLACVKESKKVSVIKAMLRTACTCSEIPASVSPPDTVSPPASVSPPAGKCEDYREKYSSSHSMCQPKSTTCEIKSEGLSAAEKTKILRIHNQYRAKVANGEETRGNPGPQPSATDMREMVWRQELADVAQAWANTCPNEHDCTDCRKILGQDYYVGQNLFWSWSSNEAEEWDVALASFYDEVEYVPNTLVDNYQSIITLTPIGHYTQLVWGETNEVGCGAMIHGPCSYGLISYPVCKVYVCNYGPGGNFIGRPMYSKGATASSCPNGKSSEYEGLCK